MLAPERLLAGEFSAAGEKAYLLDGLDATFTKDSKESDDIELKDSIVLGVVVRSNEAHVDMWGWREVSECNDVGRGSAGVEISQPKTM